MMSGCPCNSSAKTPSRNLAEVGSSIAPRPARLKVSGSVSITQVERPAPGTARTPGDEAGWQLVWADEFDGDVIDAGKWQFDVDCWGGGNNERQCYTDRPRNARVEDGVLKAKDDGEVFTLELATRRRHGHGPIVTRLLRGEPTLMRAEIDPRAHSQPE